MLTVNYHLFLSHTPLKMNSNRGGKEIVIKKIDTDNNPKYLMHTHVHRNVIRLYRHKRKLSQETRIFVGFFSSLLGARTLNTQ